VWIWYNEKQVYEKLTDKKKAFFSISDLVNFHHPTPLPVLEDTSVFLRGGGPQQVTHLPCVGSFACPGIDTPCPGIDTLKYKECLIQRMGQLK
jgi:hypothetical protein